MPTEQIVALLIVERDRLTRAIEALEGPAKRRGRPPRTPLTDGVAAQAAAHAVRRRKPRTAAHRKAHSESMRAYWAKRGKAKG